MRDPSIRAADPAAAGFERVASMHDLPRGALLGVTRSAGDALCLFNHGGVIGAVAGLCTHQAFPMSEGTLGADGTIQCAWHGARFDARSGQVVEGPAVEPIATYETRVMDGAIWVGPRR